MDLVVHKSQYDNQITSLWQIPRKGIQNQRAWKHFFFKILRFLIHIAKLPNLSGFISLHLHHQYTAIPPVVQSSDVLLSICHCDEPKRLSLVQHAFLLLVKRLGIFPNLEKWFSYSENFSTHLKDKKDAEVHRDYVLSHGHKVRENPFHCLCSSYTTHL